MLQADLYRRDAHGAWPCDPQTVLAGGILNRCSLDLDLPVSEFYTGT